MNDINGHHEKRARVQTHHTSEVEELFLAILSLENVDECYGFFEDVCTIKELTDIAQRLRAAKLLRNGASYAEICRETGMSTATISRVNRCLSYGGGGYEMVIERTAGNDPK